MSNSRTVRSDGRFPKLTHARSVALQYSSNLEGVDQIAVELIIALGQTQAAREAAFDAFIDSLGAQRSRSRFMILRMLYFADGHRGIQNQIGKAMRSTSSNVNYHVDAMEK